MPHYDFSDEVREELKNLFGHYVTATRISDGIEIDCGEKTTISFNILMKVSEIFGTMKIDVNNEIVGGGGCETCSYETTEIKLQILNPTKNI